MSFSDNFRNSFETSNNDSDMRLRTHYYGSDLENTKNTISRVLQNNGFNLIHVDNVYNEMLLRSKKEELIIYTERDKIISPPSLCSGGDMLI